MLFKRLRTRPDLDAATLEKIEDAIRELDVLARMRNRAHVAERREQRQRKPLRPAQSYFTDEELAEDARYGVTY